jgi:hypothetical protein
MSCSYWCLYSMCSCACVAAVLETHNCDRLTDDVNSYLQLL